jgi:hypothetical protein
MKRSAQIPIYDPADSPGRRIVRTAVAILILGIVGFAWLGTTTKQPTNNKYVSASELMAEFKLIDPPRQAIANGEVRTMSKGLEATIAQNYIWPPGAPPLLASYRDALGAHGWRDAARFQGGVGVAEIFCKGSMEASLQEMPTDSNGTSRYDFSISNGTMSATDCQTARP